MYLVKINKEKQLRGGIILDVNKIVEMYKNETLDDESLKDLIKQINCEDIKRLESEQRYSLKTVNVYADRGERTNEIKVKVVSQDVQMKVAYEILNEGNNESIEVAGFEIDDIRVIKDNRFIKNKSVSR